MPGAGFQYLVLARLTLLTLPWAILAFWLLRGGQRRSVEDADASLTPCTTCGGFGILFGDGQTTVTSPACRGLQPPPGGGAGPPCMRPP